MSERHGMSRTRLYGIWKDIHRRCYNPKKQDYKNYGGRGIQVCEEWKNSFIAFREWALQNGYTEELTIERNDVNGNYEPSNCRWATKIEQANNRRDNKIIEFNGERHSIAQWSKITGIQENTIRGRYKRGLKGEELFAPPTLKPRFVEYEGDKKTIHQWSKLYGINYSTLYHRIVNLEWGMEKALKTK